MHDTSPPPHRQPATRGAPTRGLPRPRPARRRRDAALGPDQSVRGAWRRRVLPAVAFATVVVVLAMAAVPATAATGVPVPTQSVSAVLTNLRDWIMGVLAALGTLFLTIAGVRYLVSGGDPGEIAKAKDALRHAAWGYGLAALAPVIVQVLRGIVGA